MKAWHVQDKYGEHQQIIFADKRSEAIAKSEAKGWCHFIDIRAKRAKYADDLNTKPVKLIQAQLENGWWFECCGSCSNHVTIDDKHSIVDGFIYCGECSCKIS
ncbi:hypothetical protein [Bacillus altitudinis]|uniref:hypothetical protein n=1 Tax=Bacillus altitudinis TaxID=293387 RepID=UPI0031F70A12